MAFRVQQEALIELVMAQMAERRPRWLWPASAGDTAKPRALPAPHMAGGVGAGGLHLFSPEVVTNRTVPDTAHLIVTLVSVTGYFLDPEICNKITLPKKKKKNLGFVIWVFSGV